ncbi:probable oligoribonuclease [Drosophila subpulchrella]|uniref:probable oligoribonuclease n=1 Tax=Drosophila subpulchrella TaxID=1486046 RepID=UPI0018A1B59A|nr:probable oligoribonuclease [Drosophila subpulchrella]
MLMISQLQRLGLFVSRRILGTNSIITSNSTARMSSNQNVSGLDTDIVWMDLEMTGLDIEKDKILEVSCIITDKDLNIKSEGPSFAINHPQEVYDTMNEWCMKHHYESGLIDRCKSSDVKPEQASDLLLSYLEKNIPKRACPLGGNSVYMDRLFINRFMPLVDEYLHYRIVDVSTIKELARRWCPEVAKAAPKKIFAHRSRDDILESISELKYYKANFFK